MAARCASLPFPSNCHLPLLVRAAAASDGTSPLKHTLLSGSDLIPPTGHLGSAASLATKAFALDKGPRPLRLFARAHFYSAKVVQEALDYEGDVFASMRVDQASDVLHALTNAYLASSRSR